MHCGITKPCLTKAGLAYPDENWDWEALATAAKKLTDTEQGIWGYLANNHGQQGYWNYIYQNGGPVVRPDGRSGFDLPQTIEAIQRYVDFIYKDQVAPPLTEADDKLFLSGKIAMRMMGSWQVNSMNGNDYAKANLDLAILPYNLVNGEQKRAHDIQWPWLCDFCGNRETHSGPGLCQNFGQRGRPTTPGRKECRNPGVYGHFRALGCFIWQRF